MVPYQKSYVFNLYTIVDTPVGWQLFTTPVKRYSDLARLGSNTVARPKQRDRSAGIVTSGRKKNH